MSGLAPDERDALYRECALAIDAVGPGGERAFLARLALLLMESLGDAARCRAALRDAAAATDAGGRPTGVSGSTPASSS